MPPTAAAIYGFNSRSERILRNLLLKGKRGSRRSNLAEVRVLTGGPSSVVKEGQLLRAFSGDKYLKTRPYHERVSRTSREQFVRPLCSDSRLRELVMPIKRRRRRFGGLLHVPEFFTNFTPVHKG